MEKSPDETGEKPLIEPAPAEKTTGRRQGDFFQKLFKKTRRSIPADILPEDPHDTEKDPKPEKSA